VKATKEEISAVDALKSHMNENQKLALTKRERVLRKEKEKNAGPI